MGKMSPTPEPCTDSKLTATHFAGKRIQIPCLSHQGNTSGLQLPSRIFFLVKDTDDQANTVLRQQRTGQQYFSKRPGHGARRSSRSSRRQARSFPYKPAG